MRKIDLELEEYREKENVEESANEYNEEEIEDEDVNLELDNDDTIVHATDGVFIGGDGEEIKILFFYFKPPSNPKEENDKLRCKGTVEFRMTPSTFKAIVEQLNEGWERFSQYKHSKEISYKDKPMFV